MRNLSVRFAGIALAAAPALLVAQIPSPAPASGFGTEDLQIAVVPFNRFEPIGSGAGYGGSCCQLGLPGERWPIGGNGGVLIADVDPGLVPNGADLEQISFFVGDTDAGLNFNGRLCRTWADVDGSNVDGDCPFSVSTFAAPGDTVVGGDPDLQVNYQYDVDNDGTEEVVSHILWAAWPNGVPDAAIRLRSVRLLYRRQVSPAPAVATFSDVPTSHPFFQFVEALSASGITAGCGTGIYCPDSPLTRGQMAVFLAKALGLHWPGPASP